MWIFTILYFLEIFTDFVDKVTDRISNISFTGSRDVPVGMSKSEKQYNETKSAVGKKCLGEVDTRKEDEEWLTTVYDGSCMAGNSFKCFLATTPGENREAKVSRWNKFYNNLRTFFRIFRINRNF
ncbi:hypothetical protein GCK72_025282 [Caenorhabditis remanei]|uniref:Uncharacterized protein n=2 Tax=Caenorhabditis remanei TaxID=31234 RepID=A0A6A5G2B1_CAERE|nr:hypothetical protein GCK72_025282 [Caenorhabditis remanei]KAF1748815.1 hypothetical protein GCK72_025282 [Caenorhabditis remanei]